MPHLHIDVFQPLQLPAREGEVEFGFIATSRGEGGESLISTRYKGREFFILHKKSGEKHLLKSDKITRPSPNFLVKHALLAYAKHSHATIIDSNVDNASENVHLKTHDALKSVDYFASDFPTGREIRLEVGFGSARHLLHQASTNPDVLFIALEIHKPSIEQALKQITIQNLNNIMILDYDARLFLEFVPSNTLSRIYVHFPVPWDKKPHRRVIGDTFVTEAIRTLAPQGRLELRTDSENYYRFALETYSHPPHVSFEVRKNQEIAVTSKYEDRWKKMEKNIYDVTLINDLISPEKKLEGDFSFTQSSINDGILPTLERQTFRRDWGFLNAEASFMIGEGGWMLRLAMGSFDRPEHLYLIVQNGKARYFPTQPVRSSANLSAHILLNELLNG
ncbi:tRNA (guanosine(46)-N7)-methyltransferase TrmB [Sulfuricurvum sp.]|uniref:tRNA (guanosine(46)-N7)-methyltransferase TrmB n=1 Tax=Sulfuricurvum sp. TaxID=2025608 RepID=UPI0026190569|nr:tRNA (guanosine(46)-N7)-methyltransferase TrmB [Sulfuricurvum sp.]MDD4950180.1 tRNA (guanosine(46)-N7)-methyltransferase TrmB [Sulfuricurvum sp.]